MQGRSNAQVIFRRPFMPRKATTYSEAGVDIEAGNRAQNLLRDPRRPAIGDAGALECPGNFQAALHAP
jgi:hypothetical protein